MLEKSAVSKASGAHDNPGNLQTAGGDNTGRTKLSGFDLALLWFGAAVVIDELWAGSQVTPAGLYLGIALIVAGRLTGNLLLGLVAKMGAATGLPTMMLSRAAFGIRGSMFPAVCNIMQLIGWTAYMLIVAAKAVAILLGHDLSAGINFWIILGLGAVTTAWAAGGAKYWKVAHRIAVALLAGLAVVMTWAIFREHSWAQLSAVPAPDGTAPMLTFDFIVAMAVSWVPLAADYGRFATSRRAAFGGTYWGYFAGSTWMYLTGLFGGFAFLAMNPGTPYYELEPNVIVLGALSHLNLVVAGLVLIVVSTITTTFLDIYSTAASSLNLWPKANERAFTVIGGLLGTALACFISMDHYTAFLVLIGIVFLPMFGVVAADWLFIKRGSVVAAEIGAKNGPYWFTGGFNFAAIIAWVAGMAVSIWAGSPWWMHEIFGYEWQPWPTGAAIPSFIVSAGLYLALMRVTKRHAQLEGHCST